MKRGWRLLLVVAFVFSGEAGENTMAEKTVTENLQVRIRELEKEVARLHSQIKTQKYGLVWLDVPEGFERESENALPILEEVKEKAVIHADGKPTHILIEGDNYHALTCLNYTHRGKVDVIYIDPPYNTGNGDFIYRDKRRLAQYPNGEVIKSDNPVKHSAWLSFMSRRLELAKNLLSPQGVIFISIDDNEQAQLKLLCDKIFGEGNFVGKLIWRKKSGGGQTDEFFVTEHEYVMVYRKSAEFEWLDDVIEADAGFNKEDEHGRFRAVKLEKWGSSAHKEDRLTMWFPITSPNGKKFYPVAPDGLPGRWRVGKKRMEELEKNGLIFWELKDDRWIPYEKIYSLDGNMTKIKKVKSRSILFDEVGETGDATNLLTSLFGQKDVFQNPKPLNLVEELLSHAKASVVLDFFAGSGTTLHATMKLNEEDGGRRQCILVNNNENGICERVTYERNRRVMQGYTTPKGEVVAGLGNSLRYYRTKFVGKNAADRASDEDKAELARKAGCLLALGENTLAEFAAGTCWQIYTDGADKVTGVYFSGDTAEMGDFVARLEAMRDVRRSVQVAAYFFSWDDGASFANEFMSMRRVTIKTIPEPILEVYRTLNR